MNGADWKGDGNERSELVDKIHDKHQHGILYFSATPETSTTSTSTTTTTTVPPTTTTTPAPTTTSSSTTTTTTTPPTTRPKPTETVLTVDILSSHSSQLPVDYDGGEGSGEEDGPISVCSEGYESINGVCVAVEPHDVKAVTNDHNRCPEGYVFVNGVCEGRQKIIQRQFVL